MKKLWVARALPAGALVLTFGLVGGCSSKNPLTDCNLQSRIDALGTAATDLADVAASMRLKLAVACAQIAGATAPTGDVTDEQVSTQCNAAKAEITANVNANVTVTVVPGKCEVAADAQLNCEASCSVSGSCDPGSIEARCDPGQLSVQCDGSCTGTVTCEASANASVSCEGKCNGSCTGSCSGTCNGTCSGTCSAMDANGKCAGSCDGMCTGSCSLSCMGTCQGSCTFDASATATCDSTVRCQGTCSGTATAPKCEATLTPPDCNLDADCEAGCKGQANLKAECTPPTIVIEGIADADFAAKLQANLPAVLQVAAQGELAAQSAGAVATAGGNLLSAVADVPACIAQVGAQLSAKLTAAVQASASVTASVMVSASVSASANAGG